jgi:hypothetical protein
VSNLLAFFASLLDVAGTAVATFVGGFWLLFITLGIRAALLRSRSDDVLDIDVKCGSSTDATHPFCPPGCRPRWTRAWAFWEDDIVLIYEARSLSLRPRYRISRAKFGDPDCRVRGCIPESTGKPCDPPAIVLSRYRHESDRGLVNIRLVGATDVQDFRRWAGLPHLDTEESRA